MMNAHLDLRSSGLVAELWSAIAGRKSRYFAVLGAVGAFASCDTPSVPVSCDSIQEQSVAAGESANVSACAGSDNVAHSESNRPPALSGDRVVYEYMSHGDTLSLELSNYYTDPDNDDLTFSASQFWPHPLMGAADAAWTISGDAIRFWITGDGEQAVLQVRATDTGGQFANLYLVTGLSN